MKSVKQGLLDAAVAAMTLAILAMAGASNVHAQGRNAPSAAESGAVARRVNMGVGKSMIVDLPRDAAEIFVADPKVANAVVRSSRKLYVIATGNGQTTVYAMDAQGQQIAALEITIGRDIDELGRILKTAMPNAAVVPRTINNTIILTGTVDSAGEAQMAFDIAKGFVEGGVAANGASVVGKVVNSLVIRGRDMVMVKVTIAEVERDVLKQLGVTSAFATGPWGGANMSNPPVNSLPNTVAQIFGKNNTLGAEIKAYERNSVARILAEPTVTTVSGENAKFTVGGEIPVPSGENCATTVGSTGCLVTFAFKPIGVTLNFTPVVLAEGRILLRVATEVTELDPTTTVTLSRIAIPGFRTRKHETSVELPSGGSIASAGLVQTISRQTINGLPGLMNLPILGSLFRSRDYQRHETELVIIITPYIAKPVKPSDVARPSDGFSDASDPQAAFLGRVNRIYSTAENPALVRKFNGRLGFIAD